MSASHNGLLEIWLRQLIGKRIVDVGFSVYVSVGGTPSPEPLQIEIIAEGAKRGMLVLSSDGESIGYSDNPVTVADMGSDGRAERRSTVPGFDSGTMLGARVDNIELILEGAIARGVEFKFSTKSKLVVMNNGDQILLLANRDHPVLQKGDLKYERIC